MALTTQSVVEIFDTSYYLPECKFNIRMQTKIFQVLLTFILQFYFVFEY